MRRLQRAYGALVSLRGHDRVRILHVRSHTRDPGNEAADRLAKAAAEGDIDESRAMEVARSAYDRYGARDHDTGATPPDHDTGMTSSRSRTDRPTSTVRILAWPRVGEG